MSESVNQILRTGDICEIHYDLDGNDEERLAICIEGKLYIITGYLVDDTERVIELKNIEDKIIRILRPNKLENALKFWKDHSRFYLKGLFSITEEGLMLFIIGTNLLN